MMKIAIYFVLSAIFSICVAEVSESEVHIPKPKQTVYEKSDEDCRYQSRKPSSCAELMSEGYTNSGVYTIYPRPWFRHGPIEVFCDMTTDGGGWTVFQRRDNFELQENFTRGWFDYRRGFGNLTTDFWLGNDYLHILTQQDRVTLRIDLEDFDGYKRHATYKTFEVANWSDNFRLIVGQYSGDAGDGLIYRNNASVTSYTFVTHDRDNPSNCAKQYKGGWWYTACHASNLNGLYLKGITETYADGVVWCHWKGHHYSLKFTEMKVRPTYFIHCAED